MQTPPRSAGAAGLVPARADTNPPPPARLSLSQILTMMLAKPGRDSSSVELSRNAKGETQISVTVRTGDDDATRTPDDAARKAREIYDTLRRAYPLANGHVGATPAPDADKGGA